MNSSAAMLTQSLQGSVPRPAVAKPTWVKPHLHPATRRTLCQPLAVLNHSRNRSSHVASAADGDTDGCSSSSSINGSASPSHSQPGAREPSAWLAGCGRQWAGQALRCAAAAALTLSLLAGPSSADSFSLAAAAAAAATATAAPGVARTVLLLPEWQRPAQQGQQQEPELLTFTWDPSPASPTTPAPNSPSSGSNTITPVAEVASESEDRLLEAARQVESRLEGVVGALARGLPQLGARGEQATEDAPAATSVAHTLIREVWDVVDANYLDARSTGFDRRRWAALRDEALRLSYRDTAAGYRAVREQLARGLSDPYSRFIPPGELEAMKKYDVSGVGLNLGTAAEFVVKTGRQLPGGPSASTAAPGGGEDAGVFVVGVSRGSPADLAGVRQGDQLLEVQGESLAGATPFRAAGLISGTEQPAGGGGEGSSSGSSGANATVAAADAVTMQQQRQQQNGDEGPDVVRIKLRHSPGDEAEVRVLRPRRLLPSAVSASLARSPALLPGGRVGEELVGTVRLTSFNARAQSDVAAALRQLQSGGATRLVLDLRDNRGGLVTEGLEVARLFLEGDVPIVVTERQGAPPETPRAPGPALTSAPLLVLVNGHTASASEIVAGALRDNCRAVLAGSRTYGKGLIQSVYELSDGSGLVITVGKYLTPRGNDIDRYGIQPDFKSTPSGEQYDTTVKACKLTAPSVSSPAQSSFSTSFLP